VIEVPTTSEVFNIEDWSNPLWRLNSIYWVLDMQGEERPFKLRTEQEDLLRNLHSANLILKARQLGFSTLIELIGLDQCCFTRNFKAVTIADTIPVANELFRTKVEFPWSRLPRSLKKEIGVSTEAKGELIFGNGSSYTVTTSARSGTIHLLHISEFGKICAKYPEKATEIVTGSFPAVAPGGLKFVESTAKGQAGRFYDMAMLALKRQKSGQPLSALDFKLHFYPWWKKPENRIPTTGVLLTQPMVEYFLKLAVEHQIILDHEQKAWYVAIEQDLGADMKSEHPSYPEEAFEVAIEGAIFAREMTYLRKSGAIGHFPWVPNLKVNTFWDLGVSKGNQMAIWMHQYVKGRNRLIGYLEGTGEGFGHYVNKLNEFPYVWGPNYLPHDATSRRADVQIVSASQTLAGLGRPNQIIVPRIPYKNMSIEAGRSFLLSCDIDASACSEGIRALDNYQREWDEKTGRWSDQPLHNWASNAADAMQQGAMGFSPDTSSSFEELDPYEPLDELVGH